MFLRAMVLIVLSMLLGAALLDLRQQRMDTMYEMAVLHSQARQARRDLWRSQSRIADHLNPQRLNESAQRAGLKLEPIANPTAQQQRSIFVTFPPPPHADAVSLP